MILRAFISKHQNEVIEVVADNETICLDGMDIPYKADFFASAWMDAGIDDQDQAIVLRDSVSVWDESGQKVYYQVEREPTIEELKSELNRRRALLPAGDVMSGLAYSETESRGK